MEELVFKQLNSWAGWSPILDLGWEFLGVYLPYLLGLAVLAAVCCPRYFGLSGRMVPLTALAAGLVARVVVKELFIWLAVDRLRPFAVLEIEPLWEYASSGSMPSGHTIFFFALGTVISMDNRKLGVGFLILSVMVGVSRVVAGLHWPGDIVMGAVLGAVVGWVIFKLLRLFIIGRRLNFLQNNK